VRLTAQFENSEAWKFPQSCRLAVEIAEARPQDWLIGNIRSAVLVRLSR
jgi:hypothetical protein